MFKSNPLGLYSKSFLSCFPSDKENNPNTLNASKNPMAKHSIDVTEKMYKVPNILMKSQDFSKDALKKILPEKNKKTFKVEKKEDFMVKEFKEISLNYDKKSKSQSKINDSSYRDFENVNLNSIYSKEIIKNLRENEVLFNKN